METTYVKMNTMSMSSIYWIVVEESYTRKRKELVETTPYWEYKEIYNSHKIILKTWREELVKKCVIQPNWEKTYITKDNSYFYPVSKEQYDKNEHY